MKSLFLALLLASAASRADHAATFKNLDFIVAHETPCTLSILSADKRDMLKAATGHFAGKSWKGCWGASQGVVGVLWEGGHITVVPMERFKKLKEA